MSDTGVRLLHALHQPVMASRAKEFHVWVVLIKPQSSNKFRWTGLQIKYHFPNNALFYTSKKQLNDVKRVHSASKARYEISFLFH